MRLIKYLPGLSFLLVCAACTKPEIVSLPDASTLGNPRGLRMARVITHYHSPYSWDACDKAGVAADGSLREDCLKDLREALCVNRINTLFLSDHPSEMERFEMNQLLLPRESDQLVSLAGTPYLNQMSGCANGFQPTIQVGFEGRLLALGMEKHVYPAVQDRKDHYGDETAILRNDLASVSNAAVFIPHTESRSVSLIQSLNPDGIEIYNIHANLDPKIRKTDLGMKPFEHLPGILTYLIDPYKELNPDYVFLQFFYHHPVYQQRWDSLIWAGARIAGIAGTDSHENIFPQSAADGERLDSHRRITRMVSNHIPVADLNPATIKAALKKGAGWVVFEIFGSPVGMDITGTVGGTTVGPGDPLSLGGGSAHIHVSVPTLHPDSPRGAEAPQLSVVLKKVTGPEQDTVVASSTGAPIDYVTSTPGAFRAVITMHPHHLREFLGPFAANADKPYPWIVTNHIYVVP